MIEESRHPIGPPEIQEHNKAVTIREGVWDIGEMKTLTLGTMHLEEVLAFVRNPLTADNNPIHQDTSAAENFCRANGIAYPDNAVVLPGALSVARCTSVALGVLGNVAVRELRSVKFLRPVFTGEEVTMKLTLDRARKGFAFFSLVCDVPDVMRSPAMTAEFVVFLPPR